MRQRNFHLTDDAAQVLLAVYQAADAGAYRTRLQAVRHQPTKVFKSRNEAAVMEFETLLEKS